MNIVRILLMICVVLFGAINILWTLGRLRMAFLRGNLWKQSLSVVLLTLLIASLVGAAVLFILLSVEKAVWALSFILLAQLAVLVVLMGFFQPLNPRR
ncbi:hypothetical protein ABB02_01159 [Clostridiaceae bacterium JG1575]|nr:hypothetical protein ABB02_01159 [Clostridiaceae bacterium JG1575]